MPDRRWRGGARYVVALTVLLFGPACEGRTGGISGVLSGSGGGNNTSLPAIAGTWRRMVILQTQNDVVTSETTWIFSAGGGCERTVVSHSVAAGVPATQRSSCSYQLASGRVTIQFGSGGPVQFTVSVGSNRLFLSGVEFTRVG